MRNGIIDSKDESNEHDAPFEEESDAHDDEYIQGACSMSLVTKRVLNLQIKEEKVEDQRENLFHTRCSIEETPCSLVIDSGSCTNVVTPRIFEPPKPYFPPSTSGHGIKELTFKFSSSAAGLFGDSFPFLGTRLICASFGSTRLMCASFGSTRLICASFGSTRLICAFYGTTRLLSRVRAQRGADRREAGRTREGHMDASGFLIASAMYFVRIFGL
ncbi:hypothetical protein E6C27_scaffold20G001720 [Cucumis melo var. makuwa]|uniref:DNA-directed RNA polymerase I subunit RPA1-like n=1 Tax=Cucumis melo var. makuwa TaxID=1194695 RepID=A0A5A7T1Q9_CUCMM|nr:hypothetical protein E6C27_scaffold20G001720 [Cucumis melo var. makuwa]